MTVSKSGTGNNSICLPFESEENYQLCMKDRELFVDVVNQNLKHHPELFPQSISEGFKPMVLFNQRNKKVLLASH
jgi:hypothetical protein